MTTTSNSPLSRDFESATARSSTHAVAEALKGSLAKGNPIESAFAKDNSDRLNAPKGALGSKGYDLQPCNPTATEASKIKIDKVPWLKGSRVAVAASDTRTKKFRVTVKDKVTGEPIEVLAKLTTTTVSVCSYGVVFRFTKTNRGQTILDSRDGKRKSAQWVKSELTRILGLSEGTAKFAELVAVEAKPTREESNAHAARYCS